MEWRKKIEIKMVKKKIIVTENEDEKEKFANKKGMLNIAVSHAYIESSRQIDTTQHMNEI